MPHSEGPASQLQSSGIKPVAGQRSVSARKSGLATACAHAKMQLPCGLLHSFCNAHLAAPPLSLVRSAVTQCELNSNLRAFCRRTHSSADDESFRARGTIDLNGATRRTLFYVTYKRGVINVISRSGNVRMKVIASLSRS